MIVDFLHSLVQKVVFIITASLATVSGIFNQPKVVIITAPQTAMVQQVANFEPITISSTEPTSTAASTTILNTTSTLLTDQSSSLKTNNVEIKKISVVQPKIVTKQVLEVIPQVITAQFLLERTTFVLRQKLDGYYELTFTTDAGGAGKLSWGLTNAFVGGTSLIPKFNISYTCNPTPDLPLIDAANQNPFFKVRTSYSCDIGLTPTTGSDRRTQSKTFSIKTDPGQLFVKTTSNIDTVLKEAGNNGGYVFDNQDSKPLTITSMNFDFSFTALSTSTPLIVRFIDSTTNLAVFDYHLENLAGDLSQPHTESVMNASLPITLRIDAQNQKLLPLQVLGARFLYLSGVNPLVRVVLKGVTLDQADIKPSIRQSEITWTCVIPTEAYNPNATSGIFATGVACRG